MFFRQLADPARAQLSCTIGCRTPGKAVVVDPVRDVDQYIGLVAREGFRIAAVTETHIHADYCSGARELAFRTGASLFLSGCGDESSRYAYTDAPRSNTIVEGNALRIGDVRLSVLHTPGHAPEHIEFLVSEHAERNLPVGLLCGDFLCVGDAPWPEHHAGADASQSAEARARTHFKALQRLRTLPDHLPIWPAHQHGTAIARVARVSSLDARLRAAHELGPARAGRGRVARSAIAASLLLLAGATSVEHLSGGVDAWRNIGFTFSTDAGA